MLFVQLLLLCNRLQLFSPAKRSTLACVLVVDSEMYRVFSGEVLFCEFFFQILNVWFKRLKVNEWLQWFYF